MSDLWPGATHCAAVAYGLYLVGHGNAGGSAEA